MTSATPAFSNPYQFDMLLLEPVHRMTEFGIRVDTQIRDELREEVITKWKAAQEKLDIIVGYPLNAEGKKSVPAFLYDELGLPKKFRKSKKGDEISKVTSDESALVATIAECQAKVKELKTEDARYRYKRGALAAYYILKIRGYRKQLSNYLGLSISKGQIDTEAESLLLDPDGRVRWTFSVGGTETARFSHSQTPWGTGLNGATWPRDLRRMCVADEGYELAEFDLQRGESWVYAHLSQDPELLRIHIDNLDFHSETASAISGAFGKPLELDWIIKNKEKDAYKIRFLGKKINHASSYRMGPFKGAEEVNKSAEETGITCTVAEFKKAQKLWLSKYFMIDQWWKEIERELDKTRTLVTPYGRVHQFHDQWGESLFKSATAYVPQSTSVDYLNRGLLRVYHEYQCKGAWDLHLLSQTHDSILVQYKSEHRHEAVPSIVEALKSKLVIKGREFHIPVDPNVGPSWGKGLKPYKAA